MKDTPPTPKYKVGEAFYWPNSQTDTFIQRHTVRFIDLRIDDEHKRWNITYNGEFSESELLDDLEVYKDELRKKRKLRYEHELKVIDELELPEEDTRPSF